VNQYLTVPVRKTDLSKLVWRYRSSSRYQKHSGQWYFQTRKGDRGPFDSREAAELELQRYIDTMEFVEETLDPLSAERDKLHATEAWQRALAERIDLPRSWVD